MQANEASRRNRRLTALRSWIRVVILALICLTVYAVFAERQAEADIRHASAVFKAQMTVLERLGGNFRAMSCATWKGIPDAEVSDWDVHLTGLTASEIRAPLVVPVTGTTYTLIYRSDDFFQADRADEYRLYIRGYGVEGERALRGTTELRLGNQTIAVRNLFSFLSVLHFGVTLANQEFREASAMVRDLDPSDFVRVKVERREEDPAGRWAAFDPPPALQIHFYSDDSWCCSAAFYRKGSPRPERLVLFDRDGQRVGSIMLAAKEVEDSR
ncbi:MAG: hypothetical protein KatS3mg015_2193 [Fimbriimonadales bacterium]|nr:MAG: hypothetical protein KatS3mg015_2193 [Fimbriimonadales bacterium]